MSTISLSVEMNGNNDLELLYSLKFANDVTHAPKFYMSLLC